MPRRRLLAAACAIALATPSAALAARVDVPAAFAAAGVLREVAADTKVPIRLPASLNLDFDGTVYGSGFGDDRTYSLSLTAALHCGANACFLASFDAEKGGRPAFRRRVSLTRHITGYYKGLTCGGSCSPPMIQWRQNGVLYSIQAKLSASGSTAQRRAMIRAANSAIVSRTR
jgi:hypothetical protein